MNPSGRGLLVRLSSMLAHMRRWERLSLFVVVFLFLAVLATLLPIWSRETDSTSYLPVDLHARETADYSKYPLGTSFPAVGLGVVQAAMVDDNPFDPDINLRVATMAHEMSLPVPTSTIPLPTSTRPTFQVTGSPDFTLSITAPPADTAAVVTDTAFVPSTFTPTPFTGPLNPPGSTPPASLRTATSSSSATSTRTSEPGPASSTPGSASATPTRTPTATATIPLNSTASTTPSAACAAYPSTGFVAAQDTWVDADKPDSSNEKAPKLQVEFGSKEKRVLMRFDLSSIPMGSTVESATLYIDVSKTSNYTVEFWEILEPWVENVTWNDQPFYDDFAPFGELALNNSARCVRTVALDTVMVENWIDYPDENYGVMMIAASGTAMTEYSSRESSTGPKLVVTYVP